MPTAFVTGATGFLGLNLVQALTQAGWEVTALRRAASDLTHLRRFPVQLRVGALEDAPSLHAAVPEGVDAVFHVAGKTGLWRPDAARQHAINVVGTRNVVRAALARGARRFVHTSSIAAYGNLGRPVTEETPSDAADCPMAYLRTKYLAEQEVRAGIAEGLDAVILNPAHVLGPYDQHNWGRSFRMAAAGRLPAPPGVGSFCHAEAVAEAHIAAFDRGRTGENYLLACEDASLLTVVQEICRLVGRPAPSRALPAWAVWLGAAAQDARAFFTRREPDLTRDLIPFICREHTCTNAKAIRELGYRPRSVREALRDCHAWLTAEGLLGQAAAQR